MSSRVLVHGLVVDSEIDLQQGRPSPNAPVDLTIRVGEPRVVPPDVPTGVRLAQQTYPDGRSFSSVARTTDGVVLRCHGVCDVMFNADLSAAIVHRDPEAAAGLDAVLVGGMGLALVLQLRGHLVLHASAVELDGAVIAVVGRSGMGKSTVATLLCGTGARIVSDDVLRVDVVDGGAVAHRGSHEARLRPKAREVAPDGVSRRVTADARDAVALVPADGDTYPLGALVVPYPDRTARRVAVQRAEVADALLVLVAFPRLVGWLDRESTGRQFAQAAELVRMVPLGEATLPWGPPFAPDLGAQLLTEIRATLLEPPSSVPSL